MARNLDDSRYNALQASVTQRLSKGLRFPALQALQAGKDLYLEKPIGHTIREGQLLVKAAQIIQTGCFGGIATTHGHAVSQSA